MNKQLTIDPHPYDMPPAERAAYANGYGQGKREAADEIASLRAELDESLRDYFRSQQEIDRLRAELADVQSGSELAASHLMRACEKVNNLEAAARRDAETIVRLTAERDQLFADYHRIAAGHDEMHEQRDDARDTIARLREALRDALAKPCECGGDCGPQFACWRTKARAALVHLPQEEPSRDAETIARLEERVAELYRAQKNRILSVKSTEHDIGTLRETIARLRKGLEDLVSKLTAIENSSEFQGIWNYLFAHGRDYRGPNWADELQQARAALTAAAENQDEPSVR